MSATDDEKTAKVTLRDTTPEDQGWLVELLKGFGAPRVISGTQFHDIRELPALIAETEDGARVGAIVFRFEEDAVEGVAMQVLERKKGIGGILMQGMMERARSLGKRRLFFTTTNDNLPAQALHASVGCQMVHRDVGGFAKVIRLMGHDPDEVEMIGQNGVPITDILHYERILTQD